MLILFLILIPFIFFLIKTQLLISLMFIIYYILYILILLILKTEKTVSCEELPLNTDRIFVYSIYNILIGIPRAKSFLLVYELFFNIKNKNFNLNKKVIFILIISFLILFFLKFSILILFGVSYFSILITSYFVVDFFEIYNLNYESKKAKYMTIFMNCFVLFSNSVGYADEKKLIFKDAEITFNAKSYWEKFLQNVKQPELFFQNYYNSNNIKTRLFYINNHYGFMQISEKYNDKAVGVNLTSEPHIKINSELFFLKNGFKPNLVGQNKFNYFTPPFIWDKQNKISQYLNSHIQKANKLIVKANTHLIDSQDDFLISLENKHFYIKPNPILFKEFAREFSLPIYIRMVNLKMFEKINEEWLNTPEGKIIYEEVKLSCREGYLNDYFDKINK